MQTILVGIACAIERLYASTSSEFYLQQVQSTGIRKKMKLVNYPIMKCKIVDAPPISIKTSSYLWV